MSDPFLHGRDRVSDRYAARYRNRSPAAPVVAVLVSGYLVISSGLMVLGLVLTEVDGVADWVTSFDRDAVDWLHHWADQALSGVFTAFSSLADTWTVVGVLVGALVVLAASRRWIRLATLATAPAVELVVFLTVSFLVARPRPDVAAGAVPTTGSYPSGHAAMAVALYGSLAVVTASFTNHRGIRRAAAGVAVVVALAVGTSRLYLGLHYLSDVLIGWALGCAALAVGVVSGRAVATHKAYEEAQNTPRRQPSVGYRVAAAAGVFVAGLLAWSFVVEPHVLLAAQHEDVNLAALPRQLDGTKVGVISDLQLGIWLDNPGMSRQAVDRLVAYQPDMVLILGDFVYDDADTSEDARIAVEIVRRLPEAGIPSFAVLGNHDYASGAAPLLRKWLPAVGIPVLTNQAVRVQLAGRGPVYVVGVGSSLAGHAAPEEALAAVPDDAARVVMMHNPAAFARFPAGTAPLAVAGHTHGGQIRVPFRPEWSYLRLVRDQPVHADGWIDGYGAAGNRLYVNRGIGMSLVPARFNCSPAITLFTLQAA